MGKGIKTQIYPLSQIGKGIKSEICPTFSNWKRYKLKFAYLPKSEGYKKLNLPTFPKLERI